MRNGTEEAARRYRETVRKWEEAGHPAAPCTGHGHPQPHCPAPGVHEQMFPEADQLTSGKALAALRAVYEDISSTGRAGDEWAYEWIHEVWPTLVPAVVRRAVGDPDAPGAGS